MGISSEPTMKPMSTDWIEPEFLHGVSEMLPHFLCGICADLIEDAVTLNCQHNFCKSCIMEWIEAQDNKNSVPCPECRSIFNSTSEMKGSRLIRNLLSTFKFICPNEGCDRILMYDAVTSHQDVCVHRLILCTFCKSVIIPKDVESHQMKCMSYVKYQKSQLTMEINCLKTENEMLKQQLVDAKEPG